MRKVAARLAAVVVALVAGAASYQHIAAVALAAGEPDWVAYSLPLAIDGLIVVGVAALLEDKAANLLPRRSAWAAVVVGVAATLAANVASAEPTITARLVAAAAPVAFLISVEVLTRSGRPRPVDPRPERSAATEPANLTATAPPVGTPALRQEPANLTATAPPVGTPDQRQEAASGTATEPANEGDSEPAKADATAPPKQKSRRTPKPRQTNAERVAAAVALTPDATVAELAARLKLSARTVQRYRPAAKAAAVAAASAPSVNGHPGGDGEVISNAND